MLLICNKYSMIGDKSEELQFSIMVYFYLEKIINFVIL